MFNKQAKQGFTLIELLVVVLIIGILASVALPQYQKAVRKARLSEVATTFNSISKGIDMYILENGYPSSEISFSGDNPTASLDIEIPCTPKKNLVLCSNKVGDWKYSCTSVACLIEVGTAKWLDYITLKLVRYSSENQWKLEIGSTSSPSLTKEICLWWKDMSGSGRVTDPHGVINEDTCAVK